MNGSRTKSGCTGAILILGGWDHKICMLISRSSCECISMLRHLQFLSLPLHCHVLRGF